MNPPAFQFYADDFIAGTFNFSDEEAGQYIRCLCHAWNVGGLTEDELAGMTKTGVLSPKVRAKFKAGKDGLLRNDRLELERNKQKEFRANKQRAGQRGASRRWQSHTSANGKRIAEGMAKHSSPSPSPSPSPKKNTEVDAFPDCLNVPEFKAAWNRWHEHLKQKRKPATICARDLQLNKLAKMGVSRAITALNHSIENNWQGIFEPRENQGAPPVEKTVKVRSGVPFSQLTREEQAEVAKSF